MNDLAVRLGGDEFVLILEGLEQIKQARIIIEKLFKQLAIPLLLAGKEIQVGASVGISLYPHDGENLHTLLKNADTAMYQAKMNGKNNYRFFHQGFVAHANSKS